MASFQKDKARKPLISDGTCYTGTSVKWGSSERSGFVNAVGTTYTLRLVPPNRNDHCYSVHLSEDEMLTTIAEWMASYTRERQLEKKKCNVNS